VEAAVVGIPDLDYGEAIRAYVVPKEASLSKEELIAYCKEHLAKYKIPHEIEFLKELPKNTTGKILRRSLKEEAMKQTRLSTSES
ncbi:MAG TPA: long-chain fatty acid--CoA ligase, partial [Massilibacterium sp.]|nr:long-chain fatty acid--CoA ligase [Massilibacterium sp.]